MEDSKGNRINVQENGIILITPYKSSTHAYTLQELIDIILSHYEKEKDERTTVGM